MLRARSNRSLIPYALFVVGCLMCSKLVYQGVSERWRAVLSTDPVPVSIVRSFESSGAHPSPMWQVQTPQGQRIETIHFRCSNPPTCLIYLTASNRIIPAETGFDAANALMEVSGFAAFVFLCALFGPFAVVAVFRDRKNPTPKNVLEYSLVLDFGFSLMALSLALGTGTMAIEMFRTERYFSSAGIGLLSLLLLAGSGLILSFAFRTARRAAP